MVLAISTGNWWNIFQSGHLKTILQAFFILNAHDSNRKKYAAIDNERSARECRVRVHIKVLLGVCQMQKAKSICDVHLLFMHQL